MEHGTTRNTYQMVWQKVIFFFFFVPGLKGRRKKELILLAWWWIIYLLQDTHNIDSIFSSSCRFLLVIQVSAAAGSSHDLLYYARHVISLFGPFGPSPPIPSTAAAAAVIRQASLTWHASILDRKSNRKDRREGKIPEELDTKKKSLESFVFTLKIIHYSVALAPLLFYVMNGSLSLVPPSRSNNER